MRIPAGAQRIIVVGRNGENAVAGGGALRYVPHRLVGAAHETVEPVRAPAHAVRRVENAPARRAEAFPAIPLGAVPPAVPQRLVGAAARNSRAGAGPAIFTCIVTGYWPESGCRQQLPCPLMARLCENSDAVLESRICISISEPQNPAALPTSDVRPQQKPRRLAARKALTE